LHRFNKLPQAWSSFVKPPEGYNLIAQEVSFLSTILICSRESKNSGFI